MPVKHQRKEKENCVYNNIQCAKVNWCECMHNFVLFSLRLTNGRFFSRLMMYSVVKAKENT